MRADAQRNRTRILAAAEEVLAAEGLSAPMRTIAERAGVGLGTIYRHFPTQEALYQGVVDDWRRHLLAEARELLSAPDHGAAFYAFAGLLVERTTRMKALVHALAGAGVDATTDADLRRDTREVLGSLLARAQDAGAVRVDLRLPELLALLNAACLAAVHNPWSDELRERALGILFDGFRPRP